MQSPHHPLEHGLSRLRRPELRSQGGTLPNTLLAQSGPLSWEHNSSGCRHGSTTQNIPELGISEIPLTEYFPFPEQTRTCRPERFRAHAPQSY
jgi:hypothetical protein